MEVADAEFVRGMRYLAAAARCEGWCGDDLTEGRLQRLADDYRARANALMLGSEVPGVDCLQRNQDPERPTGTRLTPIGRRQPI
jgi:hypothetical protein